MFPSFTVFGHSIGTYPLCAIIGLLLSVFAVSRLTKKRGVPFEDIVLLTLVLFAGILVGSHILFGITQIDTLIESLPNVRSFRDLLAVLSYCFGGSVYYGGFIGVFIISNLYITKKRFPDPPYIKDVVATVIPLFHCFGRIGCFFGGCCYGIESSFGFVTHTNTLNPAINGVTRFPVALLEAFLNLLIFIFLLVLIKKNKSSGNHFYYYMLLYSVVRFFDEMLRGDDIRGFLFGLSTSQWISILLFCFAGITLIIKYRKSRVPEPSENS